ncbi:MAG: exodeoxyribonuclease V subunit alpha [Gammaproteobacteria bacterium]|nr:exodeoxyribonuclease V subunit alpha [Gammaproteobacteria bacterium]
MHREWNWESIDCHLAGLLCQRLDSSSDSFESRLLDVSVRMLSHQLRQGHVCIELSEFSGETVDDINLPDPQSWVTELLKTQVVGVAGDTRPLVLENAERLFFQRYWNYQHQLMTLLQQRIDDVPRNNQELALLTPEFKLVFSEQQASVVIEAAHSQFSMITGGPGTGKTTVIVGLIDYLLQLDGDTRIALTAPTGKAAARMIEALQNYDERLAERVSAATIHRLLGVRPGRVECRHHQNNPLAFDAVIVDEASMIDLALMTKLMAAIASTTCLVLVGDADQLASVESGAVFGRLCKSAQQTGLSQSLHRLDKSYRFATIPGISLLADAVNRGDAEQAIQLLESAQYPEIGLKELTRRGFDRCMNQNMTPLFESVNNANPAQALQRLSRFQLLCAHRKGRWGVDTLNRNIEDWLAGRHYIPAVKTGNRFYHGQPVIVSANNYQLALYNGEIGLVQSMDGDMKVYFSGSGITPRAVSPARLTDYESAWALTVHQSQGSEFEHVVLILSEAMSPVLCRELIYTAITRARRRIDIMADNSVLRQAIKHQSRR